MSVVLNPEIEKLDKSSLCYSLYIQLYNSFFNAQDKKDEDHPFGIEEGDETSIRLKNTAYNFASSIAESIVGDGESGGSGGVLVGYLKKSGGDMSGLLRANYGFEAGTGNTKIIYAYKEEPEEGAVLYGIGIDGKLNVNGDFYLRNKKFLSYDAENDIAYISSPTVDFGKTSIKSNGEILVGTDKSSGVFISSSGIQIQGDDVYHAGNANLEHIDWTMRNAKIAGALTVKGKSVFNDMLNANYGANLGTKGKTILTFTDNEAVVKGSMSFDVGCGIKIGLAPVLVRSSDTDIQLGAVGGDVLLGTDYTDKVKLLTGITDVHGTSLLLSQYGEAYFPGSLRVRHNFGEDLLTSYRKDNTDEGIIIHKKLRFGDDVGSYLHGDKDGLVLSAGIERFDADTSTNIRYIYDTVFQIKESTSHYKPLDRKSDSLYISTKADFVLFDKPLEAKGHIGIDGSTTRLTDNSLFFTDTSYLLSVAEGIKHYGNAYFMGDLSSENFSSGFAGSDWAIMKNQTTGNVTATFDELVIRKKMRVYELEMQKNSATNGSLWISDSCSGDIVEKIV